MKLLVSETRSLRGIERDLVGSDPRLAALFSTFTSLTLDEKLPSAERLATGTVRQLGRRMRATGPAWPAAGLRGWLWPPLLLMLLGIACAVAMVGVGRTAVRSCPQPFVQHTVQGGPAWCNKQTPGPGRK